MRKFQHMTRQLPGLFPEADVAESVDQHSPSRCLPERRYVIFFTPRSGSSRLTDMAASTGYLSTPGEMFNPAFVPRIAKRMRVTNIESYVDGLLRKRNTHGTFGCEIAFRHLHNTFGGMKEMLRLLSPTTYFWLIREDIVAQAVSLTRMAQTRISHSVSTTEDQEAAAEAVFQYEPEKFVAQLTRWLGKKNRWKHFLRGFLLSR